MSQSTLRRLLSLLEESSGALSVPYLAGELEVTPGRVEGLVDFWVRKGKIRVSSPGNGCGSCGISRDCPLIINLPRTYELVPEGDDPGPTESACSRDL